MPPVIYAGSWREHKGPEVSHFRLVSKLEVDGPTTANDTFTITLHIDTDVMDFRTPVVAVEPSAQGRLDFCSKACTHCFDVMKGCSLSEEYKGARRVRHLCPVPQARGR